MIFMVLMFAVFWFILIRPQQKRAKEHANMLNGLKKGDQVITRGGIIGKVSGVQDNIVTLEVQEKVRMRIAKSYIEALHSDAAAKSPAQSTATPSDAKT
jgi:preprotein translocase subunit YajC